MNTILEATSFKNSRTGFILLSLALFIAVLIAYSPAIHGSAVWDDDYMLTANPVMTEPGGLRRIFFDLTAVKVYYPVTEAVLWLECRCFGFKNLTGFHLVNICLHAVDTIILWRLLRHLRVPAAFFAAAIFGLHPLQVESVAWVTEHKNTLSLLFYLMSMWAYLRCRRIILPDVPRHGALWYLLSLVAFSLALGAKSTAATLPAAALLVVWWKTGRVRTGEVIALLPFFLLALASGLLTQWIETHTTGTWDPAWSLSPMQQILVAGRALMFYLGKLICPVSLSFVYPRWKIDPAVVWQYAWPLTFLAGVSILQRCRKKIGRGPLTALLFFAGTLMPALGFFHVLYSRYSFVADHFQYIAGIGPLALFAAAVHRWFARLSPIILTCILVILTLLTFNSSRRFASDEQVWQAALQVVPDSPSANTNFASDLIDKGQLDEARQHLERATQLNPHGANSWAGLGRIAEIQHQYGRATDLYAKAVRLEPSEPRWHFQLGNMLAIGGDFPAALVQYQTAAKFRPDWAELRDNTGVCCLHLNQPIEAREEFMQAIRLSPNLQNARKHLAEMKN